jgi:tRNA nucleotidyltransferase (CCA-adding enzyme)
MDKNILLPPQLPQDVLKFLDKLRQSGYQTYVVGGALRDLFLQRKVYDWDFATSANPEEIKDIFPDSYYKNVYGTVTVKWQIDGELSLFQITPFRSEGEYKDGRHPDKLAWTSDIITDLSRRDFTINAMAYDGSMMIDPYAGQDDLTKKKIRAVNDPHQRFSEDSLRLIRAVRLATQLNFEIENITLDAIRSNSVNIKNVSWERIRDEFFKLLSTDRPAEGVLTLKTVGLLEYILPEVNKCFGIPQKSPKRHHIYDVGTHLVMSLKNCDSQNPITRLATLIHDVGKYKTFKKDAKTSLITFYNHEVVGEKIAVQIADRFKLSHDEKDLLVRLVAHHQFVVSEELTDNAIRRFIRNIGKENLDEMFSLRRADRLGGSASETSWRTELFKKRVFDLLVEPFTVKELKINGLDVMTILGIKPSPRVGEVLDSLFDAVVNKKIKNDKDDLVQELMKLRRL